MKLYIYAGDDTQYTDPYSPFGNPEYGYNGPITDPGTAPMVLFVPERED